MILFNPLKMGGMKTHELIPCIEYYEACCTAEYILENCEPKMSEEKALEIGYEVRRRMRKADRCDGDAEVEFINEVLLEEAEIIDEDVEEI